MQEVDYTYYCSTRSSNILADNQGYEYYMKKESSLKTFWVCKQYKNGCPGMGNLMKESKAFFPVGSHNHNNVALGTQKIVKDTIANVGVNPDVAGRKALVDIRAKVNLDPYASIDALGKKEAILRSIRYT